ncbi:MAG: Benzoyl-CoA reductase, bzd-type, BzdN subunit [Dehalococcoidia bacterium]|nr:Benzoyl-CoA reductase, bzd-type, BzdN subunit [Dehalococcoidia bacterium]
MESALATLRESVNHRHEYAQAWKQINGGKVAGVFCIYVPEEILHAMGILSVRIRGSREPEDVTEPYITGWWCAHCRSSMAEVLKGKYSYVDGIVYAVSCPHVYQVYNSWSRHGNLSYTYDLWIPENTRNNYALGFLQKEFSKFARSLEDWTGKSLNEEKLSQSIQLFNLNRQLLSQIYELRKAAKPPLMGSEAMEIILAGMAMDKGEYTKLLQDVILELNTRNPPAPRARLMLLGSENDDVGLVKFIESFGAVAVTDDLCMGRRYFAGGSISTDGDLMQAIATRYLNRPHCPQKDIVERNRLPQIYQQIEDYRVDGVIYLLEKFCEPHAYDLPKIKDQLDKMGIPFLILEVDLTTPAGQFRTRVEAFLDLIDAKVVL